MTREEFLQKLSKVDFLYDYIDNHEKFLQEQALFLELAVASNESAEFKEMFDSARDKFFNNINK